MTKEKKWQVICDETECVHTRRTSRMAVEGGWLYLFELLVPISEDSCQSSIAMQFVPRLRLRMKAKKSN